MFLLFLCAASLCVCIMIGGYIAQYESFRRKEIIVGAIRPYNYEPDSHVSASVVQVAGFYPKWKEIKGGNLVETIYRGVSLVFCDLLLSHIKGSGRTKKKHTDFEGTFMMIECHRWIEHAISIEERERPVRSVCQEGIQTENEAFNQRFEIKSDDLMEAMNVLTPRFMEKLMEADAYADARTCVKLLGNQIFVMLYNQKRLFGFESASTDEAYFCACLNDLEYILGFADILLENDALFDQSRITAKEAQG